jgi:insulysin
MATTSAWESAIKVSSGIRISRSDDRTYAYSTLGNGLRVLVISEPAAEFAAAALSVRVGSFQDPAELPGLAHFCEHMLFLGTEKFPDENEYSAFLSQHGGGSNAYTASEETNCEWAEGARWRARAFA